MQFGSKQHAQEVLNILYELYSNPHCSLIHSNPLELIVATILSAQCTDARVNIVTKILFKKYKTPNDYANVDIKELEKDIHSTGFYRSKANYIQAMSNRLIDEYNGEVPDTMEDLITLKGVGRKTANVVLWNAFGKNCGVVVDTHVHRISRRLGLSKQDTPEKIEKDLMKIITQSEWGNTSHLFISHGRETCISRKPRCEACKLKDICKSNNCS